MAEQSRLRATNFCCSQCPSTFSDLNDLQMHVKVHGDKFTCEFCSARFNDGNELRLHHRCYHSTDPKYITAVTCSLCQVEFKSIENCNYHKQKQTCKRRKKLEGIPCEFCGAKFLTTDLCSKHTQRCKMAKEKPDPPSQESSFVKIETTNTNSDLIGTLKPGEIVKSKESEESKSSRRKQSFRNDLKQDKRENKTPKPVAPILAAPIELENPQLPAVHPIQLQFLVAAPVLQLYLEIDKDTKIGVRTKSALGYQCSKCPGIFPNLGSLYNHEEVHGDKVSCTFCSAGFKTATGLAQHHNRIHKQDPRFRKAVICSFCKRKFVSIRGCEVHKQTCSKKMIKKGFPCLSCGARFFTKNLLNIHKKKCRKEISSKSGEEQPKNGKSDDLSTTKKVTPIHPKRLVKIPRVKTATFTFKDDPVEIISESDEKTEFKGSKRKQIFLKDPDQNEPTKRIQFTTKITCSYCPSVITFATIYDLNNHNLQVHPDPQQNLAGFFLCPKCPLAFLTVSMVHFHLKTHTKFAQCAMCSTGFPTVEALEEHCISDHKVDLHTTPIKVPSRRRTPMGYCCSKCPLVFPFLSDVYDHEKAHPEPFICEICSREFKSAALLKNHNSREHEKYSKSKTLESIGSYYYHQQTCKKNSMPIHNNPSILNRNKSCKFCGVKFLTAYLCNLHKQKCVYINKKAIIKRLQAESQVNKSTPIPSGSGFQDDDSRINNTSSLASKPDHYKELPLEIKIESDEIEEKFCESEEDPLVWVMEGISNEVDSSTVIKIEPDEFGD